MLRSSSLYICIFVFFIFISCSKKDLAPEPLDIVEINSKVYNSYDLWVYLNSVVSNIECKDRSNDALKEELLQDFIFHKVLLQEATNPKVLPNLVINSDAYDKFNLQLSTERGGKELKTLTGKYDINPEEVLNVSYDMLLVDALLQWLVKDNSIFISEADLKKLYQSKNITNATKDLAHVMHIFSTDIDTINHVAKELASGIQFSELANKYSESPEKDNGGDMGFISKSIYPDFFSTAFSLKEGEVSPIIKSDYGFHIFKMVRYAGSGVVSYENMKASLIAELYSKEKNRIIGEYINELYSNAKVKKLNDFTLYDIIAVGGKGKCD